MLGPFGGNSKATELIRIAEEAYTFGRTKTGDSFAVPKAGPNLALPYRGRGRTLRSELAREYYAAHRAPAPGTALDDALVVLESEAYRTAPTEVCLRVGRAPTGELVLDLGTEDGQAVLIGPDGWQAVSPSPILFWRTKASLPHPLPARGGDLDRVRRLLNIDDPDRPLILAWLVCTLIPELAHPVLMLMGEHGTAKSSAARILCGLIDPTAAELRTAPRELDDWAVSCAVSWVTCLDNISGLSEWLSDAVCKAVTGDGLLRRQLYTDSDVAVLAFRRVVAITMIDPGPLRGDLADRLLRVDLERIEEWGRKSDQQLAAEWAAIHPGALGGLLNFAVEVLGVLPAIRHHDLPRMADFGRVLLAVDKVLGTKAYERFAELADTTAEAVAESDPVTLAITGWCPSAGWQGTAKELLRQITPDRPPRWWPATPRAMTAALTRAAPTLRKLGWSVTQRPRTDKAGTRGWVIERPAGEGAGNQPSVP